MASVIIKNVAIAALVLLSSIASFAQKVERIDFVKSGSNALVWEEKVAANRSKNFVFAAKKGDKLTLGFIDDTNQGSMDLGKVSIEPNANEPFTTTIEVAKDYQFSVTNNSDKATSFRLFITLDSPKKTKKAVPKVKKNQ